MDRKRAKKKKFRIYKRNFFVQQNVDENILYCFCSLVSSSTRKCLITDWEAFIENGIDIPLAAWIFVYIFAFVLALHTHARTQTCKIYYLSRAHIRHLYIVEEIANWLNESYADQFIWINQLNYLLRFIRHKILAKANQLSKWYYA